MVADRDTLFLELRRLWMRDAEGGDPRGSGTRHRPHPINSRLGSTLLAPPPPIFGLIGVPMPINTAANGSIRAPRCRGLPPRAARRCSPFQAGGEPAAGAGREGGSGQQTPTSVSLRAVRDQPPSRAIGRRPPCERAPRGRGGARRGIPRAVPAALGRSQRVILLPPLPSPSPPCRGTRRSSRPFLAAMKCTKWKFNRPVVCVVEISGSCFGIFYDTFVYVGEA